MLKNILTQEALLEKAYALKKNKFRPGFDGMSPQSAVMWLEINGEALIRKLLRGSYDPMPAKGFRSAKSGGGSRQLAKLTALDMIIQTAILDGLRPVCEELFSAESHGWRPGRGVSSAVKRFCELGRAYDFAASIDPVACFDNIRHDILEDLLAQSFHEDALTALLMKYVKMPLVSEGEILRPEKGLLQGAPLSNLLCNLYLTPLDRFLEQRQIPFVRYGDDIVIFAHTEEQLRQSYDEALGFMTERLALSRNAKKCRISHPCEMSYLGYRFRKGRYGMEAVEQGDPFSESYRTWHEGLPTNGRGTVDILSDGILRQKDMSLLFETDTEQSNIPVLSTDTIHIYSSVILDSQFLLRAMRNQIDIHVFDENDKLIGRFIPNAPLHTPQVGHKQLQAYYQEGSRLQLAKKFVLAYIHNCRLNIRYYQKQKPHEHYADALDEINKLEKKIKQCPTHEALLLLEAHVHQLYYGCFDLFLTPEEFRFEHRSKRLPHNEVNAMISFGNTVLYNLMATAVYKSPLDIRIGFLHATNRRRESLNLDLAEAFKPLVVDRVVFSMINLGSMTQKHFEHRNGGVYLSADGKRQFLRGLYEKLDSQIGVKGQKLSYRQLMVEDVRKLTRHFKTEERFVPFKQVK